MSFELDNDYSYPELDESESVDVSPTKGRYPSKNKKRHARIEQIEDRKHRSDGNSNNRPGVDPLARTSRSGGRQPGIHSH